VVSDFSPSGDQPAASDEAHRRQIEKAEDAEAAEMSSYSSSGCDADTGSDDREGASPAPSTASTSATGGGALASDEQLAALREKLTGGGS